MRPFSAQYIRHRARVPMMANPPEMGIKVLLYIWPMTVPMLMDMMEDTEPMTAEAMPATWPIGSMASELTLPNSNPKQKNKMAAYPKNIHKLIVTKACREKKPIEAITTTQIARKAMALGPCFSTMRELIKDAKPNTKANNPK